MGWGFDKTKPALEPTMTGTKFKKKPDQKMTTQELTNQARPGTKTDTVNKLRQSRRTKPKVVDTSDIKLFLAKKKLEMEQKQKGTFIVDNFDNKKPPPPPSSDSVSATLPHSKFPLQQSAPSTVRQQPRVLQDLSQLSPERHGIQASSANKGD